MLTFFLKMSEGVSELLIAQGTSQKALDEHRRCQDSLCTYLERNQTPFTDQTIILWLEEIKRTRSHDTYNRYRRAGYRILRFSKTGSIEYENGMFGYHGYQYHDSGRPFVGLSTKYRHLFRDYVNGLENRLSPATAYHYRMPVMEFLQLLEKQGIPAITEITLNHIEIISTYFDDKSISNDKKEKSKAAIADFLRFNTKGILPECYASYLSVINHATDVPMLDDQILARFPKVDKPSLALEEPLKRFTQEMQWRRYAYDFNTYRGWVFTHFFLFLERNNIAFSKETVILWESSIPHVSSVGEKIHYVRWFYEYVTYGTIAQHSIFTDGGRMMKLPDWSRRILENCLHVKRRAGLAESTLSGYRSSGIRLFAFLEAHGVHECKEITPEALMEFHKTDDHLTSEGKNATSAKIRKILTFMAEENLIPFSYIQAITACTAPVVSIPQVLSDAMIQTIYSYREQACSSIDLRNVAMVMLGLRMGLRASDVVGMKLTDINWKELTISIVQKKTSRFISLPLPVEVANSLYRYIIHGRPTPSAGSEQYVFLKATAPYCRLTRSTAKDALDNILASKGLSLNEKQGFHILRRTFATNLLKASAKTDRVVEALGHSSRISVGKYLSLDENGMRMCPLPFSVTGRTE